MSNAIPRIKLDILMLDGTEHRGVTVVLADRMRLAEHARRNEWGTLETDPDRSIAFLAWAASTRSGLFTGTFSTYINDVETVTAPEELAEPVDPTQ